MAITKETITAIQAGVTPFAIAIRGVEYSTHPLIDLRKHEPEPSTITVAGLAGIVEYIQTHPGETLDCGPYVVHVVDYNSVVVRSHPFGYFQQRPSYVQATAAWPEGLKFGRWIESEIFVIQLMSLFHPNETRDRLIQLLASITTDDVTTTDDDSVAQQITVKQGVRLRETATVPNPVNLAPFRTFREIEQPASLFVFRVAKTDGLPNCALFEADGGRWKIESIIRTKQWLASALEKEITEGSVQLIG